MDCQYLFTVFTPTFNRVSTLPRVYESLRSQTLRDFEWLVVDDGSDDGTRAIVEAWKRDADFPIRYLWQENQGKHVAFNRGVREARGKFFLGFDSDDACVPKALERLKSCWDSIPELEKAGFTGVSVLCMDSLGNVIGDRFPEDIWDSNSLEFHYKYKLKGDKWGFHRTEVLRKYPFPVLEGTKFVSENVVWFAVSRKYKTRFVNEKLYIYFTKSSGSADQLTKKTSLQLASGLLILLQYELNNNLDWMRYAPLYFLKSAINYVRYAMHVHEPHRARFGNVTNSFSKVLLVALFPLGLALYVKDILNYRQ